MTVENLNSSAAHGSMMIWRETVRATPFYGRERELATLRRWITGDRCQVIAIGGMGGMGKTALAIHLIDTLHRDFASVIWHSLRNAPSLEESLTSCIRTLSADQAHAPEGLEQKLALLLGYLQASPCLLIFDNFEALLQRGKTGQVGHFLPGYENYSHFLQLISELPHQSCLVMTSREKPITLSRMEGKHSPVRSLHLPGLAQEEGSQVLAHNQIRGSAQDNAHLIRHYAGNPLALKLVAGVIADLFAGDLAAFLKTGEHIFSDIRDLLDEQFERLSTEERDLLFWLAIERQDLSLQELMSDLAITTTRNRVVELLDFLLRRRSWVEPGTQEQTYTLQPVIMEYITARLVERAYEELGAGTSHVLNSHALMKVQAQDAIRGMQERLLLQPLLAKLLQGRSRKEGETLLFQALSVLQRRRHIQGYAAGNILNLLILLGADIRRRDFAHLTIWQTDFQNVDLQDTLFTGADLTSSAFTYAVAFISALVFSADGTMLATGTIKGEVQVWRLSDAKLIFSAVGHNAWVMTLAFNQQGTMLASGGGDYEVCLWDLPGGQKFRTWQGHRGEISAFAFSPDGNLLASGSYDQEIKLWDLPSGQLKHTLSASTVSVTALAFSPNGVFLAGGSADCAVRIWDVSTACCTQILQGHSYAVNAVTFSAAGQHVISADMHEVRIWDVASGSGSILGAAMNERTYMALMATRDGQILSAVKEGQRIQVYDLSTQACLNTLDEHGNASGHLTFSPDGKMLAGSGMEWLLKIWGVADGQCLKTIYGYNNTLWSLAYSTVDSLVAGGGADRRVRLWDGEDGRCLTSLQGHNSYVSVLAFSPDGTMLASGSADQSIRLWQVAGGHCLASWLHASTVWAIAFSPDGKQLAGGCHDGSVKVWEVATGQCLIAFPGQDYLMDAVAIVFAGQCILLATGDKNQSISVWDVRQGKRLYGLQGHTQPIWSLAFSFDGRVLASGSGDQQIRLWDMASGQCLRQMAGHQGWIGALAFSRNGDILVSGGSDYRVNEWSLPLRELVATFQKHKNRVSALALSPDGKRLISSDFDEKIIQWDVQTTAYIRHLTFDRLYERMDITGVSGITDAQKQSLRFLGAKEAGQHGVHDPQTQPVPIRLTRREREILLLIAAGKSNEDIMQHLVVSKATVKTHINHLFAKLQVRDRFQALRRAQDLHLL